MKRKPKSALIKSLSLVAAMALLTACDSINWPHVYGPDEVPQSARDADRPIPSTPPTPKDTPYPLVGAVPSHPKDFTPPAVIDQTKQQMENDRDEAKIIKEQVQTPAVPPQ